MASVTATGTEITDATRALGIDGDGLSSDSSFGVWPRSTNLHPNPGFETDTYAWDDIGGGSSIARVSTDPKFGSWCLEVVDGCTSVDFCSLTELRDGAQSLWVKADGADTLTITLATTSGVTVTDAAVPVTTGWTRAVLFYEAGDWATATELATLTVTRNGGGTFWIDGVQTQQNENTEIGEDLTDGILTPYRHRDDSIDLWPGQANLHPNGGFETNTTGWTAFGAVSTLSQSTDWAIAGTNSLKVVTDATPNIGCRSEGFVALTGSATYVVSCWLHGPATEVYQVEVTDASGRRAVDFAWAPGMATARKIMEFTATATPGSCSLYISKNGATAVTFYVDDVQVKQQPENGDALYAPDGFRDFGAITVPAVGIVRETTCWFAIRARLGFGTDEHPAGSVRFFRWSDGDDARLESFYAVSTDAWGVRRQGPTVQASAQIPGSSLPAVRGQTYTVVGQYTPTTVAISVDGSGFDAYEQSTQGHTDIPVITDATVEIAVTGLPEVSPSGGMDVVWFACGMGDLTSADLTALDAMTTFSRTALRATARLRMVWEASTLSYQRLGRSYLGNGPFAYLRDR